MQEKSIKKNFIMNAILTMSTIIFPIITFPYISRVLQPEGTGKVNLALSVIAYFNMFAQLGIPTYGIKACAQVRNDRTQLTKTVHELAFINIVMCAFAYIVLAIVIAAVPKIREEKTLYIICSATIILSAIGMEWLYQGLEEYAYITKRSVGFKAIAVIAMFALIHEKEDYVIYAAITVFATGASSVVNFINSSKYIDLKWQGNYHPTRHIKVILVFFALACTTTIYTNLDNVMLGFMTTDMDVGLYSAAVKIKTVLIAVITSLGAVILPRASYYIEKGSTEDFRIITQKAMKFVIMAAIPIVVYFILYANESIRFIAGEAYADATFAMQIIMPTVLFIGITNLLGMEIMVPTGRERAVLYSTIIGAIVDIIINALLIPIYGPAGAAVGTLVAELAVLIYQVAFLRGEARDVLRGIKYCKILIGVIAAGGVSLLIKKTEWSLFWQLAVSAIIFFGIYGLINIKEILELCVKDMSKICMRDTVKKMVNRKWIVLVCIVIFAVIGALLGYKKGKTERAEADVAYEELVKSANEEYESTLSGYDSSIENCNLEVEKAQKQVDSTSDFMNNSVYMKLDPSNIFVQSASFFVNPAEDVDGNAVAAELQRYVTKGGMREDISSADRNLDTKSWTDVLSADLAGNVVTVTILQSSSDLGSASMDAIIDAVEDYAKTLNERYGSFKVDVTNNSQYIKSDINIAYTQINHRNNYFSYEQNLNNQIKARNDQENAKKNYEEAGVDAVIETKIEATEDDGDIDFDISPIKEAIKYAIIGALLGWIVPFAIFLTVGIVKDDEKQNA